VAWQDGRLVKLGGILGEQIGDRLILGLGVNLTEAPQIPHRAIQPTCLKDLGLITRPPVEFSLPIAKLWNDLAQDIQPLFQWPDPGTPVRWEDGQGTCLGWEPDGRLKVTTAAGSRRLSSGEISGLA
jgi:biotin-(acetyl-CoA carboxylase) ligase